MKSIAVLVSAALMLAACAKQPEGQVVSTAAPAAPVQPVNVPAGAYTLDKAHASLVFSVNHLGFSHYTAKFKSFDAQLQFDPKNFGASAVSVTVDPRSLDLNSPPAGFVDELTGEHWLDAGKFPTITFKSTKVEDMGGNKMRITGDFSLHGVTKPLVLDAMFNGGYEGHPMDPHARIGFSASGTLKRSDFGIAYGIPEPGSTMGVSDEVKVAIEAEFSGPPLATPAATAPAEKK